MNSQGDKIHRYAVILLYSIVVTAFAQFKLDILMQYFMVSLGIVLIPLLYLVVDSFPIMPVAVVSGLMVALSRFLTDYFGGAGVGQFSTAYLPETFFYIIYAFLLLMYCDSGKRRLDKLPDIIALTFIDYVANMMELVLRQGVQSYTFANQMGIICVGFFRALIVFGVIWLFRSYRVMLMKHEDVRLYQQLLLTATELSGETVWMKENMQLVETTMNEAYRLYDGLKDTDRSEDAQRALSVATKVHEIKKQYYAVSESLSMALKNNMEQKDMRISEIASILLSRLKETADQKGIGLSYSIDVPEGLRTERYYDMMSVLNNLFTNALEAARGDHEHIGLSAVEKEDGSWVFTVQNDGKPISDADAKELWTPGYSTKLDYESGAVGRGLGLPIVKDIIEKKFAGTISFHSNAEETIFVFIIPKEELEVKA